MVVMDDWREVRLSIPPDELDDVPDDSIDYECWTTDHDALTIYKTDGTKQYYLHRNKAEVCPLGEVLYKYESYEEAKEELERQKHLSWPERRS